MVDDQAKTRRIALFIDFENLVTNTGITAANFDLRPALDRLLENGKVIFRRAYCDWSRFRDAKEHLHLHGVELVDVPPSTRSGKNGADMRLVIDALELCYAREHIDTYVIASGDSDFCPLAYKLRENDRYVIGIAVKQAASQMFVKACDEFIYLRNEERVRPSPQSAGRTRSAREDTPPRRGEVPSIAREIVTSLLSRAVGPINPSFIKEALVRKQPDFDEREHGFATFSRLLEALEKEGLCRRQQQGRQWYVMAPDGNEPRNEPTAPADGPASPPSTSSAGGSPSASLDEEAIPDPSDGDEG